MYARADKFISGHYAFFAELPERVSLETKVMDLNKQHMYEIETRKQYGPKHRN
ncbi:MAG: hypothetical protein ABIF10_05780 [Candidatus Woesearchaeota archaeon]